MQPDSKLTAYKLAEILLRGKDYPVIIFDNDAVNEANFIQDVYLYQHSESPFEFCLLLSSEKSTLLPDEIEVPD